MTLSPTIFVIVMLAALAHASWNALVKADGDKLVMQTYVVCIPGLVSLLALPFVPLPAPASWPYLATSVVVHQLYFFVLLYAYRHGDLSQVYPIARGLAPALVALSAWVLAGEAMAGLEIAGLVLLSLGILTISRLASLLVLRHQPRPGELQAVGLAILTALTIAVYSTADGLGVRLAGSAPGYILWLLFLEAIPLGLVALWLRRGRLVQAFGPAAGKGLLAGVIGGLAYGMIIWAMGQAPLAHVVALRETSVILAAWIGTRMMGEPFGRQRLAAAALVACGAAILEFGGS